MPLQFNGPRTEDAQVMEAMIDRMGLYEVLSLLEAICADKADRIRTGDRSSLLAAAWDGVGSAICEVSSGGSVAMVSP